MAYKKSLDSKEQIHVVIKDGYQNGDILKLDNTNANYSWNNKSKTLSIETNDSVNIADTLKNLSLVGKEGENRFVEVNLITQSGDNISLKELEMSVFEDNTNKTNTELKSVKNLPKLTEIDVQDNILYSANSNILEEIDGVDFLDIAKEESIPYTIKQLQTQASDVYTILKNSLEKQQEIEIWGYDLKKDKVDITQIASDLGAIFEYSVNGADLELQVHSSNTDYSIILKEVNIDKVSDNIEEAITNIIINPNKA